jgi:hypothetical protein
MADRLSGVYFQAYSMAVDAARDAELAHQYEHNASDTFIHLDYWNSLRKGLCAGETLSFSLAQMKKAYVAANQRKLEIEKTVSLVQLDPQQILSLRAGKPATFRLTEAMFDLDFPGHYARQIASVSISIPGLAAPSQNVNATLIQESGAVVMTPDKSIVEFLVQNADHDPSSAPRGLRENWMHLQEIAV